MKGILKALMVLAEITGRTLSEEAAKAYLSALSHYPEAAVLLALNKCMSELNRFPTVADVVARIDDGRPGAEAAWAMIPKNESASVVWSDEMAQAYGVCRDLVETDLVAARMAFKEAYISLVSDARSRRRPPNWSVSFGHDPRGRDRALVEAVQLGRLSAEHAQKLLPEITVTDSKILELIATSVKQIEGKKDGPGKT